MKLTFLPIKDWKYDEIFGYQNNLLQLSIVIRNFI